MSSRRFTALIACAALVTAAQVSARSVTDHLNRTVDVPDKIERVAVADIFPYASVTCVYLGGCGKLVAVHPASLEAAKKGLLGEIYPEIAKADTHVFQGADVNIEALAALKPDVVFVNAGNKRLVARLVAAGLPALAVSTGKWDYNVLDTYEHWIELLAAAFPTEGNASAALERAREIEKMVSERTADIPQDKRRRVLYLVQYDGKKIVTSGSRFFGQYWAQAAGAVNVASGLTLEKGSAVIDFERVLAWNPDAVFITNFTRSTTEDVFKNTYHDWSEVAAVKTKSVYRMPLGLYRSYTPSADSPLTLLWTAVTLYPERFADIDFAGSVVSFYKDVYGIDVSREKALALFPVSRK